MSTEHQRYSLEIQTAAIAEYAEARGFAVVQTYTDAGKSGLSLKGREGLKQLLADVVTGKHSYSAILVLDVSRWGRFQDADQSAHYEFLCRDAGVAVRYCGEPFENDGSMGRTPYGIRRLVVGEHGGHRFLLGPGEQKGLMTDRVVFVPGPPEEVGTVRRIFRMFVSQNRNMTSIVKKLNEEGVPSTDGRAWTLGRVRTVLTSELMTGYYVYNRKTRKMKATATAKSNPPDLWIRTRVMDPIVDAKQFAMAQRERGRKSGNAFVKPDMIDRLKRLFREKKKLSRAIINACPYTPCIRSYYAHFGSLRAVYAEVGYESPWPFPRRDRKFSDEDLLNGIRRLRATFGFVSVGLINRDPDLPSCELFRRRFGSIIEAYGLAGFPTTRSEAIIAARKRAGLRLQEGLRYDASKSRSERDS
ncbi:MAG: recombinase family protein [Mesorhizobium sp.]|nr:MAG: recombinase family protein [Mesorhizobium sp.]